MIVVVIVVIALLIVVVALVTVSVAVLVIALLIVVISYLFEVRGARKLTTLEVRYREAGEWQTY